MQVLNSIIAYGKPLSTLNSSTLLPGEQHWLGFHFMPFFYPLALLYALFPSPILLEAVHSIAIALATIPVYLAARALKLECRHACIAGLAYLFNPFTINAGVFGFMDYSLEALWMAIALWGLAARRFGLVVLGALLLLLTKEHYGVSVMMIGLLWWKLYGDKRRGLMLAAAGLATMLLVMLVIMPYFRGSFIHPMLAANASSRYGWLLSPGSWGTVLPQLIKNDLMYLTVLLGMLCFLPIAGAWWLMLGAADFAVILLVVHYGLLYDPHSLPLIPVLTVAACAGYMRLSPRLPSRVLVPGMAACGLAYVYLANLPFPLSINQAELPVVPQFSLSPPDAEAVRTINALVPPEAPLSVQINIGMFFNRRYLYIFPRGDVPQVVYAVLYLDSPWMGSPAMAPKNLVTYRRTVTALLDDPDLKIIYWKKPWLVLSRSLLSEDIKSAHAEVKEVFARFMNRQYQIYNLLYGR